MNEDDDEEDNKKFEPEVTLRTAHTGRISQLKFVELNSKTYLISTSIDCSLRVHDLISGAEVYNLKLDYKQVVDFDVVSNGIGVSLILQHEDGRCTHWKFVSAGIPTSSFSFKLKLNSTPSFGDERGRVTGAKTTKTNKHSAVGSLLNQIMRIPASSTNSDSYS